jgi:tRNA-(ms[2]io[6]A)-hydroxylase
VSRFTLRWETPVEWVAAVEGDLEGLLSDHAHCELQAAAAVQSLMGKNLELTSLVRALTEMAREELEHFGRVHDLIASRGLTLRQHAKSPYTEQLIAAARMGRGDARLDRLLVAGLIEARSLERFRLLSRHLADRDLADFYRSLMASEAGHQALFHELAAELAPPERLAARIDELERFEAEVVAALPFAARMHSGPPPRSIAPSARTGSAALPVSTEP